MNDIQKFSVLIVVMAAVLCDLHKRCIPNGIIATGLAWGFFYQCIFGGGIGICLFLGGILIPVLVLGWLYYFRMIGAGDIKLLSVVGGFLGPYACMKNMITALFFGGMIALWIMVRRCLVWERLLYLAEYMNDYVQKKEWRPYLCEVEESARFSFSVPVLFAVLCYIGGIF